jgi:hypothetical protein
MIKGLLLLYWPVLLFILSIFWAVRQPWDHWIYRVQYWHWWR